MIKLFRAIKSEHRRLWCKRSSMAWVAVFALLGGCLICICDEYVTDESSLVLSDNFTEMMFFSAPEGYSLAEPEQKPQIHNEPQEPASGSDAAAVSGSDAVSGTDAAVTEEPAESSLPVFQESGWRGEEQKKSAYASEKWYELQSALSVCLPSEEAALERQQKLMERVTVTSTYRLKNNIEPGDSRLWQLLELVTWLLTPFAAAVMANLASDMFAGEYSRGTVCMNFSRPVTRVKQYLAKLITAGVYSAMLMASAFLGALLTGSAKIGVGSGRFAGYINQKAYDVSWVHQSAAVLLCCWAAVVMSIAICAAIGYLTRSRAASAIASVVIICTGMYFGRAIAPVLGIVSGISLFSCLDLTAPLVACANYPELSFADCVISFFAHLIIIQISGYSFMRSDVAE